MADPDFVSAARARQDIFGVLGRNHGNGPVSQGGGE